MYSEKKSIFIQKESTKKNCVCVSSCLASECALRTLCWPRWLENILFHINAITLNVVAGLELGLGVRVRVSVSVRDHLHSRLEIQDLKSFAFRELLLDVGHVTPAISRQAYLLPWSR